MPKVGDDWSCRDTGDMLRLAQVYTPVKGKYEGITFVVVKELWSPYSRDVFTLEYFLENFTYWLDYMKE